MLSRSKAKLVIVNHINVSMPQKYTARSSRIIEPLIPFFYPMADHLVSVSKGCMTELARVVPKISHRQSTIFNPGWDDALLKAAAEQCDLQSYGLDANRPLLLSVGRVVPQKDHKTLLRALKILKEKHGIDFQLAVVGDGDLEHSKSLADDMGLGENVMFCGALLNPYPLFRQADVFVLSSTYEGLGIVLIEAMVLGCPIVSTDCPFGPSEVLDGGKCGVLVPVADPEALAEAIRTILTDKELRDELVALARARANQFSAGLAAKKYEELIMSFFRDD